MAGGGGGSQGGAIRAGRAFVELFATDNKLYRVLDGAAARLKAFGAMSSKIGGGVGAAGLAIATPLATVANAAGDRAATVKSLADRFGTTTEAVSALAYAFEQGGAGIDEFGGFLDGLASKVRSAADNNDELIEGLRGLNGRMLLQKSLPEQFDLIADKIRSITVESDRVDVANSLGLGRLIPQLKGGRAAFADLAREADRAGAIVDDQTGAAALQSQRELTKTWQFAKYAILEVGNALIPTRSEITSYGASARALIGVVRGWITENRQAIVTTAAVGAGLVAAGAGLVGLGSVMGGVGTGITVAVAAAKLFAVALSAILSPAGLVIAAVTGLGYLFAIQTEAGREMTSSLSAGFDDVRATAVRAWGDIADAIRAGDWQGAAELGLAYLRLAWAQTMQSLSASWASFRDSFVTNWTGAIDFLTDSLVGWVGLWEVATTGSVDAGREKVAQLERELEGMRAAEQAARDKAKADDAAAARGEVQRAADAVNNLRRRLEGERLRREEEEAHKLKPIPGAGAKRAGGGAVANAGADVAAGLAAVASAAKGIYSGPVAQQLAIGDQVGKRQLDAVVNNTAPLKVLPGMAQDIKGFVQGAKFK